MIKDFLGHNDVLGVFLATNTMMMGYLALRSKPDDLMAPGTERSAWLVDLVNRVSHAHLHLSTHTIFSTG